MNELKLELKGFFLVVIEGPELFVFHLVLLCTIRFNKKNIFKEGGGQRVFTLFYYLSLETQKKCLIRFVSQVFSL